MATRHVKGTRIVENTWKCASCDTVNRGRDMQCKACGSPKEQAECYIVPEPSAAPTVTDPGLLKLATRVPHWQCRHCGSDERSLNRVCTNCGGSQDDEYVPTEPDPPPRAMSPLPAKKPHPRARAEDPYEGFPDGDDWRPRRDYGGLVFGAGAAFTVVAVVALIVWIFVPHRISATVSDISWEYVANLHQRVVKHGEGWRSGMPFGAYEVSCRSKQRGTENCRPYQCNPHAVTYNCNPHDCNCRESCSDRGDGFSTCTTTCSTCYDTCEKTEYDTCYEECPVYEDWCTYMYDEWPVVRTERTNGSDHETYWPDLAPDGSRNQKLGRTEAYKVDFSDGEEVWTYEPDSLGEYKRYNVGDAWVVKVNRARQVWPEELLASE